MGLLRSIFGPSKDEVWGKLAREIGGSYDKGGWFEKDALRLQAGEWEVVLDTFTRSQSNANGGSSSQTYTRMRAPFINKDNLYFKIYQQSIFSPIGKFFGMQDIEIGDPLFDQDFVIKGNDEQKISLLFNTPKIKTLIERQPRICMQIKDDEGWFGADFPEGVDQLYFQCLGVIKDETVLRDLFELFSVTLERLVQIDSAYEDDPAVVL